MALLLNQDSTKIANVSVIFSNKETIIVLFNKTHAMTEEKELVLNGDIEFFIFGGDDCENIEILDAEMKDIESTKGLTSEQYILTLSVKR